MTTSNRNIDIHFPTLIAISVIAFIVQNFFYQFLGQAFAVWMVKGHVLSISSSFVEYELLARDLAQNRYIAAGGMLTIFFVSGISIILLQTRKQRDNLKYFYWLLMTVTLMGAMNGFFFSGISGLGDWNDVIAGTPMYELWRIIFIFGGFALYIMSLVLPMNRLNTYIGRDNLRHVRGFYFTFIPYISGCLIIGISTFLNSKSILMALSATGIILGVTSGIAWMSQLFKTNIYPPERGGDIITITPSKAWIISAIILSLLFIFVFGSGISFS
jgi:hypothetical protein